MAYNGPEPGARAFRQGLRALLKHRPDRAIKELRLAADLCPASQSGELSRRLYWLALALLRLDRPELALKSLASAQKLRPRGRARELYQRRANEYGMLKRPSPELDDFYAFYAIKAGAYLNGKPDRHFSDVREKDAVIKFIGESWLALSRSGRLKTRGPSIKLAIFREWPVAFPAFGMDSAARRGKLISADFRKGVALRGAERCPCGSGLPFMRCCGRTQGLGEYLA